MLGGVRDATDSLLEVSMKRAVLPLLLVLIGLLATPVALASDSSLEKALKPYKTKLTTDIAYLAGFKAPAKSKASAASKELGKIESTLNGAKKAAKSQQASSTKGRTGQADVIAGVTDALTATSQAKASAAAAKSGKASTAKADAKTEFKTVSKAIPLLETGGKDLGLF
jgi:hypothetical protein